MEVASSLNSNQIEKTLELGVKSWNDKQVERAKYYLHKVLEHDPSNQTALKYMSRIRKDNQKKQMPIINKPVDADTLPGIDRIQMFEMVTISSPEGNLQKNPIKEIVMEKIQLTPLKAIEGFEGACLVDSKSGMTLGSLGGGSVDLEVAAAGNTQVMRAKLETMKQLNIDDRIEDILISLGKAYHLIRPLESNMDWFLYLALDRDKANLAMARHVLKTFEKAIIVK